MSNASLVLTSLDSLRSLQLASISDLIFASSIDFFATLSCHKEERNWAMHQVIEKFCSSEGSKLKVRILSCLSIQIDKEMKLVFKIPTLTIIKTNMRRRMGLCIQLGEAKMFLQNTKQYCWYSKCEMWDHFLFTFYQNPYKLKQWHLFRFIKNYFISIKQYNKLYLKRNFENILPFGASFLSLKFHFHMKHLWVAFIMIVKFISSHILFCYLKKTHFVWVGGDIVI